MHRRKTKLRTETRPARNRVADALANRFRPAALGLASLSLFGAEGGAVWAQTGTTPAPTTPAPAATASGTTPTLPEVRVQDTTGFRTDSSSAVTRTDTPVRDIPQFVNFLPQELLRSQNATTLVEALRNVPGISYGAAEGGSQANQVIFLRGFMLNQDIFINGVRDMGEYNRDLFATESIEVLKGSSALLFGRGSPAGLINQTFKSANPVDSSEVLATFGSFDQKRITADVNMRAGDSAAFRVVALAENSGFYRYPQDVEKYGIAPSFYVDVAPATRISGSYYYLTARDVTDYGQPLLFTNALGFWGFPDISPRNYYGYKNYDRAKYDINIADLVLDHQFSQTLSLKSTLRYSNYKRESESTISTLNATDFNGNPVTRETPLDLLRVTRNHDSGRTRDNDDTAVISQTELTWRAATGSVKHVVLGGLLLADEKLDRTNYLLDANPGQSGTQAPTSITSLVDPDYNTALSYTKEPNTRGKSEAKTASVYVQDQMEFTPEWKALLGIRYDYYDSEARVDAIAPTATSTGPFSRSDSMWSGRAGLIWQPTARQSYYFAWGNAYNPSGELGVYGGTANTNLNAINENLKPEETENIEVGAQWDIGTVQIRGSIFRTEKDNARMVNPDGVTVLEGKRRVEGVEFEFSGLITPDWEIFGGIAFMDGKIVRGPANVQGNTPVGVPDVAGSVWTVYKLGGGWEVGGGLRGQSGAWLTDTNIPGSQIPGYVVIDAMVAYVQPNWSVQVNGYNLGDKHYWIGGYQNAPNRGLPGQPVSGSVTFSYRF